MHPAIDDRAVLSEIWCGVLDVPSAQDEDDFFALGGGSLAAVAIVARIREQLGAEVGLADLAEAADFGSLLALVRAAAPPEPGAPELRPVDRAGPLPASLGQEELFSLSERTDPERYPPMLVHFAFRLTGPLRVDRLERALRLVAERHELLRTGFHRVGTEVRQRIEPAAALRLRVLGVEREAEVAGVVAEELGRPFDRTRPPLARCTLVEMSTVDRVLLVVLDHFICDGVSVRMFVRDLADAYRGLAHRPDFRLPAPGLQFADWAHWQRAHLTEQACAELAEYWRRRLGPRPEVTATAFPEHLPSSAKHSEEVEVLLPAHHAAALRETAGRCGVTLYALLLGGFLRALAQRSGQRDFCVVTSVANRHAVAAEEVFGPISHDAYLRVELPAGADLDQAATLVQHSVAETTRQALLPNTMLWERIWPSATEDVLDAPAFYFGMNRPWLAEFQLPGVTVAPHPTEPVMPMPGLECTVVDLDEGLLARFTYLAGSFPAGYVEELTAAALGLPAGTGVRR